MYVVAGHHGSLLLAEIRSRGFTGLMIGYGFDAGESLSGCEYVSTLSELTQAIIRHELQEEYQIALNTDHGFTEQALKEITHTVSFAAQMHVQANHTINTFSEIWTKQLFQGLPKTSLLPSCKSINLQGLPVVVVAPGPSLTKNTWLLGEACERCVVISLIRAFNAVDGFQPHFLIVVDHQPIAVNLVKDFNGYGLFDYSVYDSIYSRIPKAFMFAARGNYDKYLTGLIGEDVALVVPGVTVSFSAVVLASLMGASKIALVGVDLAFENGVRYADGAAVGEDLTRGDDFEVQAYNGDGTVKASSDLHRTRIALENFVSQSPGEYYNCTEGGARIEGFKNLPFRAFLQGCDKNPHITEHLEACYESGLDVRRKNSKLNLYRSIRGSLQEF